MSLSLRNHHVILSKLTSHPTSLSLSLSHTHTHSRFATHPIICHLSLNNALSITFLLTNMFSSKNSSLPPYLSGWWLKTNFSNWLVYTFIYIYIYIYIYIFHQTIHIFRNIFIPYSIIQLQHVFLTRRIQRITLHTYLALEKHYQNSILL